MNRLSGEEAQFLTFLTPMLNDSANKQLIINLIRKMINNAKNAGYNQAKDGWSVDQNWNEKDLR